MLASFIQSLGLSPAEFVLLVQCVILGVQLLVLIPYTVATCRLYKVSDVSQKISQAAYLVIKPRRDIDRKKVTTTELTSFLFLVNEGALPAMNVRISIQVKFASKISLPANLCQWKKTDIGVIAQPFLFSEDSMSISSILNENTISPQVTWIRIRAKYLCPLTHKSTRTHFSYDRRV